MKRTIKAFALILALIMVAVTIVGCGSGSTNKADDVNAPTSVSTNGAKAENNTSDAAEPAEAQTGEPAADQSAEEPSKPKAADVTIEEAVIFEQDGIKITAKSLNIGGTFGPELKLLIENDTSLSVTVQTRNSSVNGYMIGTMFSADVASGKKANDEISFMRAGLETAGITTIADFEFSFHIFDSDTWDTIVDSEMIRVETSAAEGFEYLFDDSGDLVYNENGIEIVVKGLSESASMFGPSVVVYISNLGNQDVTVQARNVSINGFMQEPIFSCDIPVGKHAIDTITFMNSELEKDEITSIDNVELSFHIFDMNTWDTIVDTSPVTIDFD